ncbi:MAG: hypothetical protein ACE5GQ_11955 [Nitrospinales bacterium]
MITLADGAAVSVLPEDFESRTAWEKNFPGGQFSLETSTTHTGSFSLFIEGEQQGGVVVQASLPGKLKAKKNSLAVMAWATKNNKRGFRPLLLLGDGNGSFRQLRMEQINSGMSMYSREDSPFWGTQYWEIGASVGLIPPNEYAAKIFLAAAENRPVFYDSIRLFIIELE